MSAHQDIGPTLEILMAGIADVLQVKQDELPPSLEGIIFNALLDAWQRGNKSAHTRPTIPPPLGKRKVPTDPAFPPVEPVTMRHQTVSGAVPKVEEEVTKVDWFPGRYPRGRR